MSASRAVDVSGPLRPWPAPHTLDLRHSRVHEQIIDHRPTRRRSTNRGSAMSPRTTVPHGSRAWVLSVRTLLNSYANTTLRSCLTVLTLVSGDVGQILLYL